MKKLAAIVVATLGLGLCAGCGGATTVTDETRVVPVPAVNGVAPPPADAAPAAAPTTPPAVAAPN